MLIRANNLRPCLLGCIALASMCNVGCVLSKCNEDHDGSFKDMSAVIRNDLIKSIPIDASMIRAEFIGESSAGTMDSGITTSKSLTYALLSAEERAVMPDIQYGKDIGDPGILKKHILKKGYATLLYEDNIERIDLCVVANKAVSGVLYFDVPRIMKGHVYFRASYKHDQWKYDEFVILRAKQKIYRMQDNKWNISPLMPDEQDCWENTIRKSAVGGVGGYK